MNLMLEIKGRKGLLLLLPTSNKTTSKDFFPHSPLQVTPIQLEKNRLKQFGRKTKCKDFLSGKSWATVTAYCWNLIKICWYRNSVTKFIAIGRGLLSMSLIMLVVLSHSFRKVHKNIVHRDDIPSCNLY